MNFLLPRRVNSLFNSPKSVPDAKVPFGNIKQFCVIRPLVMIGKEKIHMFDVSECDGWTVGSEKEPFHAALLFLQITTDNPFSN